MKQSSLEVEYTVEPLHCGHLGGPGEVSCIERCPHFRNPSIVDTCLGGPGEVSCIERCPHFRGKLVLRKHIWDIAK